MFEYFKERRESANIILAALILALGIYIGFHNRPEIDKVSGLLSKETQVEGATDFSPFWKVWNSINEKYPEQKTTDQEKVYGAISGLVDSLGDPYSVFFSPDEAKLFEEDIQGSFGGIGIEIGMREKILTVIAPLKNTPAERAGLKSGDKILKINDTVTSGMNIDEAVKLIRGEEGSQVRLTIFHDGDTEPKEVPIVRGGINIPTLDTEYREDGIYVITLYSFSANSPQLFQDALARFRETGSDKLLLDLRGNPGGFLDAAVSMASWFLEGGKPVVLEDYGDNRQQKVYRSHGYDVFTDDLKFAILINEGSASASEILAGAMQDYGKAVLIGEKTYGKGSVQEIVKITPDTILKITIAKWLTPNGTSIEEDGLTPDYEVSMDGDKDSQLEKAIDLLLKM